MKMVEKLLYICLTIVVFAVPTYLQYIAGYSGLQAADDIALLFLVWVILTVYYLAKWLWKLAHSQKQGAALRKAGKL
ncbi:MAG: hypothetical protein QXN16_03865 [Candidatus Micrarchaeaceae archaeon]